MTSSLTNRTLAYVLGLIAGVGIAIAVGASAGEGGEPADCEAAKVIPYDGVLEWDGVPVNGAYTLRFRLYAEQNVDNWDWEGVLPVEIVGGRFSTLLGVPPETGGSCIPPDLFRQREIYLSIAVEDPDDPDADEFFELANRQRIVPTPYAYVATEAPDFVVNQSLTVRGDAIIETALNVSGPTSLADGATITGDLTVSGSSTLGNGNLTVDGSGQLTAPAAMIDDLDATTLDALGNPMVTLNENGLTSQAGTVENLTASNAAIDTLDLRTFASNPFTFRTYAATSGTTQLTHRDRSYCTLSRVEVLETDVGDEWAGCDIGRGSPNWIMVVRYSGDARARCEATCFEWPAP